MRDDFNQRTKDTLARRVGMRCSNPKCRKATAGPAAETTKSVSIGVAAHITAASPGGTRYDESASSDERSSIENGIWLCQNCAKLIDSDSETYTVDALRSWKHVSEQLAHRGLAVNQPRLTRSTGVDELVTITEVRAAAIVRLMARETERALNEYRKETSRVKEKHHAVPASDEALAESPGENRDVRIRVFGADLQGSRWSAYENESAVINKLDELKQNFLSLHIHHKKQLISGNAIAAHELVGQIHALVEEFNRVANPPPPYRWLGFGIVYCAEIVPSGAELAKPIIAAHARYPGTIPHRVYDVLSKTHRSYLLLDDNEGQNVKKILEWERAKYGPPAVEGGA